MCGIAGAYHFSGSSIDKEDLNRIIKTLHHRGPDGNGFYIDHNIGFTHNRLSIIDLSENASQPMVSADENYVITYNGEIYNFKELKSELEKKGYLFKSNSDTEVLLNGYQEWKEKLLDKLNGMFAFSIYNKTSKQFFLARDRYGIKPLYYFNESEKFVFSSEIKGITSYLNFKPEIDKEAVLEYFTFQNLFTDKTFFKDVKLFPAGHYMYVNSTGEVSLNQFWDYNFSENEEYDSYDEYLEAFNHHFTKAVKRQLLSDVEIGTYLSGGMDSGSITAVSAMENPYIKSFTCGFDLNSASGIEINYDERQRAEYMSYLFKTEHYEMVLKSGDMERVMPAMAYHLEEPRVGQSYPNYYAAKLAGKFVKVVLGGTGGDELFGGYPWRYYRAVVNDNFENYIDKYYLFWQRLIPNKTIHEVFAPIWSEVSHVWTRDIFRDVFKELDISEISSPEQYVNLSMYLETKTFLHGLLIVEDKLSMAHSLESRVPFLDNDLVDFALKVPVKYKLGNLKEVVRLNENEPGHKLEQYFNKTKDGKLLMRKAMEKYIPSEVTNNAKQGFSAPDASWFKGESIEYVKSLICHPKAFIYEFMDFNAVKKLVDEHMEGKQNRRLFIWSLLYFENWLKEYYQ